MPDSYALTVRSAYNGDGTYSLDGAPFNGPIRPASVAGYWVVGGYNFIYHSGNFFDPTQGVQTFWFKVIANTRGDSFVLGNAAAGFPTKNAIQPTGSGPLLAKFSGIDQSIVFATYLSSIGFKSLSALARDKGGNIYLGGYDQANVVLLAKLSPNAQKVLYTKSLPNAGIRAMAADAYSQLYVTGTTGGGIPIVNAPQPNFGGQGDSYILVYSPKADRIVYSSYLGGKESETSAGIGVDSSGNASVAGTDLSYAWDGRPDPCNSGYADCSEMFYFAVFGPLRRSTLPAKLNFHTRDVGTTTVLKASLKNTGNVPLSVSSITVSGPAFAKASTTCSAPVKPDKMCTVSVAFTPTAPGKRVGTLTVNSDSLDSPQSVLLTGTGQ